MGGGRPMGGIVRTGGVAGTSGRLAPGLASSVGESTRTSGHVAGNAMAGTGERSNVGTKMNGGVTSRATGVRGVMLSGDAAGRSSGMLSAAKQNVHLDSGTQMTLGIAMAR